MFDGRGAFIWNPWVVEPERLAHLLRGFDWAAILVHDGLVMQPPNVFFDEFWLARFRASFEGRVGGWGVLRTLPTQEAQLATSLVRYHQLGFYIANAEIEYKRTDANNERCDSCFERSRRFVDAFGAPVPRMLSTYPRLDLADLDWPAWVERGWHVAPQAYMNDFGDFAAPHETVAGAKRAGWPAERIHPTIGLFGGRLGRLPASAYALSGLNGWSFYLVEQDTPEADYDYMRSVP